jgi:hypothetical protein
MKTIPLTQNKYALVDDEDYEYLNQFKWHIANKYAARDLKEKEGRGRHKVYMHREILNLHGLTQGDHKFGNKLDNQKKNLRPCTNQQNTFNGKKRKGSSQNKGVYFMRRDRVWVAEIGIDGKGIYLGRFKTEEAAAIAYNEAAIKYFGEFARLNVIV